MATAALRNDFVNIVASEMATGVERAVECWLIQIEPIVMSDQLTSFAKLDALRALICDYQRLTGKNRFEFRLSQ